MKDTHRQNEVSGRLYFGKFQRSRDGIDGSNSAPRVDIDPDRLYEHADEASYIVSALVGIASQDNTAMPYPWNQMKQRDSLSNK